MVAALIADGLAAFVALEHLAFLALEMFLWDKPLGRRVFGLSPDFARQSAALAMNQGLYNGFLAAGLIWGLWARDQSFKTFFLGCVVLAGTFGALTLRKPSVFVIQALPALLALLLLVRR